MKQAVTNSEMGTFRTCPRRWGFEYVDGLRPKLAAKVLTWGNTIHAGIEAGYLSQYESMKAQMWPTPLSERAQHFHRLPAGADMGVRRYHKDYLRQLDEAVQDGMPDEVAHERREDAAKLLNIALWAVEHFFEATKDDLVKLVPLGFEVPFSVPVPDNSGRNNGLYLEGMIDAVWWDPEMQRIIVDDHKTVNELVGTTEKRIALDPQMSGYLHAASYLARTGQLKPMDGSELPKDAGDKVGACRYNCIRRAMPSEPHINKVRKNDGAYNVTAELAEIEKESGKPQGLVSAAQIDTTVEIYREAINVQGSQRMLPHTDKQRELLERLRLQGDRYFARFEFWRNAQEREDWRREVWIEAKRMRAAERLPVLRTRNAGACTAAHSMPCTYRAVCLDDAPETRALYRIADKRHEEVR